MYGSEPKKIKGDTTMYNIENKSFILTYELIIGVILIKL